MTYTPSEGSFLARVLAAKAAADDLLKNDPEYVGAMEADAAKYDYDPIDEYDGGPW